MTTTTCPHCGSPHTQWKLKVQKWDCLECEERFEAPPPEAAPDPLAEAEAAFLGRAKALANSAAWLDRLQTEWPAPIAYTYKLLRDLLRKGQIDASAMVFKDMAELLARFSALVMARDILAHGPADQQNRVREMLFAKPLSMGAWIALADQTAMWITDHPDATLFAPELASLWRVAPSQPGGKAKPTALQKLLSDVVNWRNETIGHGVRGSDLAPLMADLERFLGTGKGSLPEALQPHLGLWQDLALADADGTLLMGADAMHTEPASGHELAAAQPLHLVRTSTKARLELQPFLTARRCLVCQKVETFHYDSTYPRKLMPDFRLLNYERGHAFQIRGGQDQSLLENYTKSHPPEVLDDGEGFDTAVLSDDVARMLEEQNVEKSYLSPAYLRDPLKSFIEEHQAAQQGGLYWLRAPAHVGKSTFVRGLDPDYAPRFEEDPLIPSLAVAVFYIRREYQYHLAQFGDQLRGSLQCAFGVRAQNKPLPVLDLEHPSAKAFCTFLKEFQTIGRRPLLLIIDGLDELAEEHPSIVDYLPPSDDGLPPEVFILLTSRPMRELAPWLQTRLEPLRRAPGREVGLNDDSYTKLLREYAQINLKPRTNPRFDLDALMPVLLTKSDQRFLYFRFLVERLADGDLAAQDITRLAEPEQLVLQYLKALRARYAGTALADLLDRTLLHLALAERAFDLHQQRLPALVRRPWMGLPMPVLCEMVEAQRSMTPRLASVIYLLKPLLGTWHGDDASPHYRLGIKGLDDVLQRQDPQALPNLAQQLIERLLHDVQQGTQQKDRAEALDWAARHLDGLRDMLKGDMRATLCEFWTARISIELLAEEFSQRGEKSLEASCSADALSAYSVCDMLLRWLSGSDAPNAGMIRTQAAQLEIWVELLNNRGLALRDVGDFHAAAADSELTVAILEEMSVYLGARFSYAAANNLATAYMNRGNSFREQDDTNASLADQLRAIMILESQRLQLGGRFPNYMADNLAKIYKNRGDSLRAESNAQGALDSYDHAFEIWEDLRVRTADKLSPEVKHSLAMTYTSRGNALSDKGDNQAALEAYHRAIDILEDLRACMGEQFATKVSASLAHVYLNRGLAKRDQSSSQMALDDYTHAINIWEELLSRMGALFTHEMADGLARAYMNRGDITIAQGNIQGALGDYTHAIDIWENMRIHMGAQFPRNMAHNLASALSSRDNALHAKDKTQDEHDS